MFDPEVLKAVEDEAKARGEPKSVAHARARRYAKEIVPAFSAYTYFRVGTALARRISTALYRVRLGAFDEATLYQVPPTPRWCSSSITAPTWTTCWSPTWCRRARRSATRSASGRACGRCRA